MEINRMSKEDLIELKEKINDQLKRIKVNSKAKIESNTILSLKRGDNIFGICLSFGGHRLEEPTDLIGKVDIADYCKITGMEEYENGEQFRLSISHPTLPFGIGTTINKEDYKNGEYSYLNIDTMKSGYDSFYTLKPESWKEDLKRDFEKHMKRVEKYHQQDLEIYRAKLNMFLEYEDNIIKLKKE